MREILFRGRSIETRLWYCGGIINTDFKSPPYVPAIVLGDGSVYTVVDVDPDTVEQFTGLTDKNGKKIFEGDILKIAQKSDGTGRYYIPPLDYPVNVVVRWDLCAWMWETLCADKRYIGFPDAWCHFECEVIGNIHDNPELLEV